MLKSWRLCGLLLALIPNLVWAQAGYYVTPSVSASEVYDDNIFNVPSDTRASPPPPVTEPQPQPTPHVGNTEKRDDFISRGTARLKGGYQSEPFTLLGAYQVVAEGYAENSEESEAPASQQGSLESTYATARRLRLSFFGQYSETKQSRDLNAPAAPGTTAQAPTAPPAVAATALETRRARSRLFDVGPAVDYELDLLTTVSGGFSYSRSSQVGSSTTDAYLADASVSRKIDPRNSVELAYGFRSFRFDNPSSEPATPEPAPAPPGSTSETVGDHTTNSHNFTVGGSHDFSPVTSLHVRAGPRFTEGDIDPEAFAELSHRLQLGLVGVRYTRTLTTAVGASSTLDSQGVTVFGNYELLESLLTAVTLSYYHDSENGSAADVYRAGLSASYRLREWLSLIGTYEFSYQDGSLSSVSGATTLRGEVTRHNVVQIGIAASKPYRID